MDNPLKDALERLHQVNVEYNEAAKTALPKIRSFSRTVDLLMGAVKAQDRQGYGWKRYWSANMDALKRPPAILTAALFKKHD